MMSGFFFLFGNAHFAGFVLCDFVLRMLFAALTLAIGAAGLGNVDLRGKVC